VPPLVSEAVGNAVKRYLKEIAMKPNQTLPTLTPLPTSRSEAARWIVNVAELNPRQLRKVPLEDLKQAWYSVAFLFFGLHPDGALDHGPDILRDSEVDLEIHSIDPRIQNPYYERSGWPVFLENLAAEAWRRYDLGELEDEEFYCSDAQMAGACHRSTKLVERVRTARAAIA